MNIQNKKLRDAISSLILSHPFFAAILLQQNYREDNTEANPTCAVDGESFFYNSPFIDSLSFDELKGVCAHEACHIAGLHHCRMGGRDPKLWNQAADYAINGPLHKSGLSLPSGALLDPKYEGQSAEDIYRILKQEDDKAQQEGKPKPSDSRGDQAGQVKQAQAPQKESEEKTLGQLAKAQSIARQCGDGSPSSLRELERAREGLIDFSEVLRRFFDEITQDDYSFLKPNKRHIGRGIILPSLHSQSIGRIVLAIDTSGSISTSEVSAMVQAMQDCLAQYANDGITHPLTVIYCDYEIQGIEELGQGDTPSPKGGGGTRYSPVFSHLQDTGNTTALVYLTDGECSDFGEVIPPYPVLWGLIRECQSFSPPFGEVMLCNSLAI